MHLKNIAYVLSVALLVAMPTRNKIRNNVEFGQLISSFFSEFFFRIDLWQLLSRLCDTGQPGRERFCN